LVWFSRAAEIVGREGRHVGEVQSGWTSEGR